MNLVVEVPLPSGEVVLVDAADGELVRPFRWHRFRGYGTTYAVRNIQRPDGGRTTQRMHTLITGWPEVDHRNGNGLDNRRVNLRPATRRQNNRNQTARPGTSSYKGVSWYSRGHRWHVRIGVDGRQIHLGYFANEFAAARAYDAAARKIFGEFATLNFPQPGERPALRHVVLEQDS